MNQRNENRPGYKKTQLGWIPQEWGSSTLKKTCSVIMDGTHFSPQSKNGPFLYVTSKNIKQGCLDLSERQYISKSDHDAIFARCPVTRGQVLLTKDGASTGNACINTIDEPFSLLSSVAVLDGKREILSNAYLVNWLLSPHGQYLIQKAMTGLAITRLTLQTINALCVPLPPLPEQEKIAEILSAWDRAIEQTVRLIDAKQRLKKGLMQQLLTGRMRFPEFGKPASRRGDLPQGWGKVPLRTHFKTVNRKNGKGCQRVLTASGRQGLVDQQYYFDRHVASHDLKGYYLLKRGEFAYNRSSMNGYPYGAIKRLEDYDEGVLSILYICFSLHGQTGDSEFFAQYFESGLMNRELRAITQVGARAHGLLNVAARDFMDVNIKMPLLKEQQRIAVTLSTLDRQIKLLKNEEAALRKQKKGLMQKLLTGEVRVKVE